MSKYTPGPWRHQHESGDWFVWAGPYIVALAYDFSDGETENAEDNARLIAAAPDLLAALHAVLNASGDDQTLAAYKAARSAIAKAEDV